MKTIGVIAFAALLAVAAAQSCRCTITQGRTCDTIQLVSPQPDTCQTQVLPCEPCFCDPEGDSFCPTDVVQAYQYTDAPLCELQDTTVARCPTSPPTPTPGPTDPVTFQCIFDDAVPFENYECVIPADIVPGGVTSIDLDIDQTWNATLNAICGEQVGVGNLVLTIEHYVVNDEWTPNDPVNPPFGMGRRITDVQELEEVIAADQCQGTGDSPSEVERLPKAFIGARTQAVGASEATFVATINSNAGSSATSVFFNFEVNTGVEGELLGSGLVFANTRIVFNFTFNF